MILRFPLQDNKNSFIYVQNTLQKSNQLLFNIIYTFTQKE